VIDVRADDRIKANDAEAFAATARACAQVGWSFVRVGAAPAVTDANLRWLAGYRHPRCWQPEVAAALMGAFALPRGCWTAWCGRRADRGAAGGLPPAVAAGPAGWPDRGAAGAVHPGLGGRGRRPVSAQRPGSGGSRIGDRVRFEERAHTVVGLRGRWCAWPTSRGPPARCTCRTC
jgi:hypothetical protein